MKSLAAAAALALATFAVLAAGCGRYGAPHRIRPPSPAAETAPVTDPAVAR